MPDFTPRPTVYKGIKMRSRLEAGFAQWLDSWDFKWEYEPGVFASPDGQYLPDFRVDGVPILVSGKSLPHVLYVEVKPDVAFDMNALRRRMLIIRDSDPSAELVLVRPGQQPLLAESDLWLPMVWIYDVTPIPESQEYLLLAMQPDEVHPWPHGYWNGPH